MLRLPLALLTGAFATWCRRLVVITRLSLSYHYSSVPPALVCQLSSVIRYRAATGQALLQRTHRHTHTHYTQSICPSIYPSVRQTTAPTYKVQTEMQNQQVFLSKQGNVPSTETYIIMHKQAVNSLYQKRQNFCIGPGWKHTFVNPFTSSKEKEKRLCFLIIILRHFFKEAPSGSK